MPKVTRPANDVNNIKALRLTDTDNGDRFASDWSGKVRYSPALSWLIYDGKRWARGAIEQVRGLAQRTARSIYRDAAKQDNPDYRAMIVAWVHRSLNSNGLDNMLREARAHRDVLVSDVSLFDSDPYLLNVQNGTLDLRTQTLRPHNPNDLLTRICPVSYHPDARSLQWDQVLQRTIPEPEVRRYIQRCFGYSLTGDTSEDVAFFIFGPTRTGKGTILGALLKVLGDYGETVDQELLGEREKCGGGEAPRPALVRLIGVRMAAVFETSARLKLSSTFIKSMAGSDPITARELHKSPVTFKPNCKFWVTSNHFPEADGSDDALWERVRVAPFGQQLDETERRPNVRKDLETKPEHLEAILAWGVEGCRLYVKSRLSYPQTIRDMVQRFRRESDPVHEFFEDQCVFGANCSIDTESLLDAAKDASVEVTSKALSLRLQARGCTSTRLSMPGKGQVRGWKGVTLKGNHIHGLASLHRKK